MLYQGDVIHGLFGHKGNINFLLKIIIILNKCAGTCHCGAEVVGGGSGKASGHTHCCLKMLTEKGSSYAATSVIPSELFICIAKLIWNLWINCMWPCGVTLLRSSTPMHQCPSELQWPTLQFICATRSLTFKEAHWQLSTGGSHTEHLGDLQETWTYYSNTCLSFWVSAPFTNLEALEERQQSPRTVRWILRGEQGWPRIAIFRYIGKQVFKKAIS